MGARPASDDPRSLRSREQILAALHETARAGTLTSISALSTAAGVTRATFYNHFDTIEEAAWTAISESFDELLEQDLSDRRQGTDPATVGIRSLTRIIEVLRAEPQLVRFAEAFSDESDLPGLAGIILALTHGFRANSDEPSTEISAAQDVYVSAGLYALLAEAARGDSDPAAAAAVAYSLLPEWMQRPTFS